MAAFEGTKTLQPFSPRWADPELLEKTSIGRKALIDKLEQLAIEGAGGPNKYQRLIIGPRGSGKTHVLKVLHTRLWRNLPLREKLLIVYLLEDELGVASIVDFLVRLLRAILAANPDHRALADGLEALYDLPAVAQHRRAVELLLQAAGDRDILILMENLGVTFDSKQGFGRKGQQSLRDLVQQNPRFMIFATSQALLDGISDPQAPFYEFFKIEPLRKLSFEEALDLLVAMANSYGKTEVVEYLATPEGLGRVRAIYAFTGGNHRLLVNFYSVLAAGSLAQLSSLFIDALEPLKPYYQEQMRSLSAQQQKIVQFLSVSRTPKTVKEIARGCLVTSNTVSGQMQALLDRRLVERIPQGRESYYEISETLFRICYEADLDQGAPVRLFVDFLGNLYTAKELERRARGFRLLASGASADARAEAELYEAALQRYHGIPAGSCVDLNWKQFFEELLQDKAFVDVISFAMKLGDAKGSDIVVAEATAHAELGHIQQGCDILRKKLEAHPHDPVLLTRLGDLLQKSGDHEGAIGCYEVLAQADPMSEATFKLADSYCALRRHVDAERVLRARMESAPHDLDAGMRRVGVLLGLEKNDLAMELALRLSEHAPNDLRVRLAMAAAVAIGGSPQEGLTMLESVVGSTDTRFAPVWYAIGSRLLGQSKNAAVFLERAISLDPQMYEAWLALAAAYLEAGIVDKAEPALHKVISLMPSCTSAWVGLAILVFNQGRRDEAIRLLEAATQADDQGEILQLHGRLHLISGTLSEALQSLHKSIQLNPGNTRAHLTYAEALFIGGRIGEATDEVVAIVKYVMEDDADALRRVFRAVLKAAPQNCSSFLNPVLETFHHHQKAVIAKRALTLAALSLLKERESTVGSQSDSLIMVLEDIATRYPDFILLVKLLKTGIAYARDKDETLLLELTKEERELLVQELAPDATTGAE